MGPPSIYSMEDRSMLSGITTQSDDELLRKTMISPTPPLHLRVAYSIAVWSFKAYFVAMLGTTRLFQKRPALQPEIRSYPVIPELKNRVFRPAGLENEQLPVYLDVHGGGWAVADPETDDEFCSFLASRFRMMVVSIDYHKSPRHKFPIAVHDVTAMVNAVLNDESLNIDRSKVVLGGFSAGGNLAFAASQMEILEGRIHGLVGLYAALDLTETLQAKLARRPETGPSDILASSANFLDYAYVPQGTNRMDPLLSPIHIPPENLPGNVYLVGAEYDMLCHEANQMAERLAAARASRHERGDINGISREDGWRQGGIRWECARNMQHAFTHISKRGQEEKARIKFCEEMYTRIGSWLTEEVWSSSAIPK